MQRRWLSAGVAAAARVCSPSLPRNATGHRHAGRARARRSGVGSGAGGGGGRCGRRRVGGGGRGTIGGGRGRRPAAPRRPTRRARARGSGAAGAAGAANGRGGGGRWGRRRAWPAPRSTARRRLAGSAVSASPALPVPCQPGSRATRISINCLGTSKSELS